MSGIFTSVVGATYAPPVTPPPTVEYLVVAGGGAAGARPWPPYSPN